MSVRLFRHEMGEVALGANSDRVVAHCPLPSETTLNNVWGDVQMVNNDGFFTDGAILYGADGFTVPHPDPDTVDSIEDIWDRMIQKDADVGNGALNIDTAAANVSPHFEAGEPDLNRLIDMVTYNDDFHWFKRRKILSFANSPTGFHWVTGGVSTFSPRDAFKVRSRKNMSVDVHSLAMFGMTIPSLTSTNATKEFTPPTKEWVQQKYIEMVVEQAWMWITGLVETGAETPWEDAAVFVQRLLEPDPFEDDSAAWFTDEMRVWAMFTWDVTVPGRRSFNQISIA